MIRKIKKIYKGRQTFDGAGVSLIKLFLVQIDWKPKRSGLQMQVGRVEQFS